MMEWNGTRQMGVLATKKVVTLHTVNNWDWQADLDDIDCGEFDGETGAPIYTGTVGFGDTEAEAIDQLFDRIECNALQKEKCTCKNNGDLCRYCEYLEELKGEGK